MKSFFRSNTNILIIAALLVSVISVNGFNDEIFRIVGSQINKNFPFKPSRPVNDAENNYYILDNLTETVFKYDSKKRFIKKFSAVPDILENRDFFCDEFKGSLPDKFFKNEFKCDGQNLFYLTVDINKSRLRILDSEGFLLKKIDFSGEFGKVIDLDITDGPEYYLLAGKNGRYYVYLYNIEGKLKNRFVLTKLETEPELIDVISDRTFYIGTADKVYEYTGYGRLKNKSKKINIKDYSDLVNKFGHFLKNNLFDADDIYVKGNYIFIYSRRYNIVKIYKDFIYVASMILEESGNNFPYIKGVFGDDYRNKIIAGNYLYYFNRNMIIIKKLDNLEQIFKTVNIKEMGGSPGKFIGVDSSENYYFWSSIELSYYWNEGYRMPVIKVFDNQGTFTGLIKNNMWPDYLKKYDNARKYVDYKGNIYFITEKTIEKYNRDGIFQEKIVDENDNLRPLSLYVNSKYIIFFDKLYRQLIILKNNGNKEKLTYPLTALGFYVEDFCVNNDDIFFIGRKKNAGGKFIIREFTENNRFNKEIYSDFGEPCEINFSKDGSNLAYIIKKEDKYQLWIIDRDGINPYMVYQSDTVISKIKWAGDDRKIQFIENGKIKVLNMSSNDTSYLFNIPEVQISDYIFFNDSAILVIEYMEKPETNSEKTVPIADTSVGTPAYQDYENAFSSEFTVKLDETLKLNVSSEKKEETEIVEQTDVVDSPGLPTSTGSASLNYKIRYVICLADISDSESDSDFVKIYDTDNKIYLSGFKDDREIIFREKIKDHSVLKKIYIGDRNSGTIKNSVFKIKKFEKYHGFKYMLYQWKNRSQIWFEHDELKLKNINFIRGKVKMEQLEKNDVLVFSNLTASIGFTNYFGEYTVLNVNPGNQRIFTLKNGYRINKVEDINLFGDKPLRIEDIYLEKSLVESFYRAESFIRNKEYSLAINSLKRIVPLITDIKLISILNRKLLSLYRITGSDGAFAELLTKNTIGLIDNERDFENALSILQEKNDNNLTSQLIESYYSGNSRETLYEKALYYANFNRIEYYKIITGLLKEDRDDRIGRLVREKILDEIMSSSSAEINRLF